MSFHDKEKTYLVVTSSLGPHNEAYESRQTIKGRNPNEVLKKLVAAMSCSSANIIALRLEYIPEVE